MGPASPRQSVTARANGPGRCNSTVICVDREPVAPYHRRNAMLISPAPHTRISRLVLLGASLLVGVVATSCASADDESASVALDAPATVETGRTGDGSPTVAQSVAATNRAEIVEASVTVQAIDVPGAADATAAIVRGEGGTLRRADVRSDPTGSGVAGSWAVLEFGVPPGSLGDTIDRLGSIGTIVARSQQSVDVTDQVIDLDTRIASAERSIARVQQLLDDASDLDDVVLIEGELTRRQTDLETLLATRQVLADRIELSKLTVEITSVDGDGSDSIGDAFRTGGQAFVAALRALALTLGYLAPFLAVAAVVVWAIWFSRRRVRRNRSTAPPPPPAQAPGP